MPTTATPDEFLSRFSLPGFRPGQKDVVQSVLDGHDVLCVMPTGGGKSLCYQLPSLMLDGLTIVVSPLIALMKDQVDTLQSKGIGATLINSTLSVGEQIDRMEAMANGKYELVYIAPERLRNAHFLKCVRQTKIALLAVDEAHCTSEWGHDFRPDYARLGQFRTRQLGGVQTIALTATATPTVRDDIVRMLSLHQPKSYITGFSRDNLHLAVKQCGGDREKDTHLEKFLRSQKGSGIVYAATRKRCEEIAAWLPQKLGKPVGIYHGGLDPDERRRVQEDFMADKLAAIVATNAFGMGIDKADIRYVVHYNMPGSLEAYYQEAGRAGRDGNPSDCLLLFSYADRYIQEFFIENNYPTREVVQKVYAFLQSCKEDPIELTLQEIKEKTNLSVGGEAVGTAERLLAKTRVLERLDSSANQAVLRIDSTMRTLVDLVPRDAKVKRRVLQAAEKIVGNRRGEDVYFSMDRLVNLSEQAPGSVKRMLRDLKKLNDFDFVPPFRGRAIHFRQEGVPFHELDIDFKELESRKRAEYEKLDHVIRFAQTPGCRQLAILNYFGDPGAENCNNCDRCHVNNPSSVMSKGSEIPMTSGPDLNDEELDLLTKVVRIVLSGLARTHGRFGKGLVAQMLSGSQNKKLQQVKLDRLSTYGLLKGLKQAQVADLLDAVCDVGMAEQIEVTQRRPTIRLTPSGEAVMKGTAGLPAAFNISRPLRMRAIACVRTNVSHEEKPSAELAEPKPQVDQNLTTVLRGWRRDVANEQGVPAYCVFSNATLEKIAAIKPQNSTELEAIDGVGDATVEQYGTAIIELIATSGSDDPGPMEVESAPDAPPAAPDRLPAEEESPEPVAAVSPPEPPLAETPTAPETSTAPETPVPEPKATAKPASPEVPDEYWTWKLLNDGYSADECCQIRRLARREVIQHLLVAARHEHQVQLRWVAGEHTQQLTEYLENDSQQSQHPPDQFTPELVDLARELLGRSDAG